MSIFPCILNFLNSIYGICVFSNSRLFCTVTRAELISIYFFIRCRCMHRESWQSSGGRARQKCHSRTLHISNSDALKVFQSIPLPQPRRWYHILTVLQSYRTTPVASVLFLQHSYGMQIWDVSVCTVASVVMCLESTSIYIYNIEDVKSC